MNKPDIHHPYALEVRSSERKPGMYEWSIRRHGKLIQRSDRLRPSKEDARADGEKAIEQQFSGVQDNTRSR